MKTILTSLALFAATFASATAGTEDTIRETAMDLRQRMEREGCEVQSTYGTGTAQEGANCSRPAVLEANVEYVIAVEGAAGATDVDVLVYDENGNLVASDTDGTNVCKVLVNPRWTGEFQIVVTMTETDGGVGSYVLLIGNR